MKIAERIEELYRQSGLAVFVPGSFSGDEAPEERPQEVIEALRLLDDEGRLREYDILVCPYNHVIAEGRPGYVRQYEGHSCPKPNCPSHALDADDEYETFVFPRFMITSVWKTLLDDAAKKKSTQGSAT